MDRAQRIGQRPPIGLVLIVALAHALLIGAAPRRAALPPAAPAPPALWTRAIAAAPAPPAVAEPAPQPPAPVVRPPSASRSAHAPRVAAATSRPARTHASARGATHAAPPVSPVPVRVPGSATLDYAVSGVSRGLPYEAEARLHWQRDAARYEATWTVNSPHEGARTQRSEGVVTPAGLAPERFAEKARGERAAHFDPEGARIRFSANAPDAALHPGAQDRLSVALQLGALLAAAPARYPPGTVITVQTAGVREAEPWAWEVQDDEILQLAGHALPSARLVRAPPMAYAPRIELWLARTLGHLPVRLRVTQASGDVADQQLRAVAGVAVEASPPGD